MPIGTLTLGICMDLNPHSPIWWAEGGPFELAEYCLSTEENKPRTNVLLLLNAWLDTKEELEERWDLQTLNYWMARLRPLWQKADPNDGSFNDSDDEEEAPPHHNADGDRSKRTIVVICNRCGDDNGELTVE